MIDVIIPTRNAPESLWLCLTHLWAFAPKDAVASVILLDNCSTDPRNAEILMQAQSMPNHQVMRHERNVGVWCSINRGLSLSRSRYAMVLTSDVLIGPYTIPKLLDAAQHSHVYVGPDVATGLHMAAILTEKTQGIDPDLSRYNGACWLMDWPRLKNEVGWYDPQFYIAFGDVDYMERVRDAAKGKDVGLLPCLLRGDSIVHLDKQSRRADMTVKEDTSMEMEDGRRFRQKWKDRPDVLAKHPELSEEQYISFKERDLGGWEAARVK